MNKEIEDLRLVIIPCREEIPVECYKEYESAYKLWEKIWSKTLHELDGVKKLHSNEFTRHDFASVIFKGDEAISLMCYSRVNMKLPARHNDSWFASWDKDFLKNESHREGEGLIAAWFCTDPFYRQGTSKQNINVTEIIAQTFGKLIIEGNYNMGYGVTRDNRNVADYAISMGGRPVASTKAHGCDVTLVIFDPQTLKEKQLSYSHNLKFFWSRRIDYRRRKENEQSIRKTA